MKIILMFFFSLYGSYSHAVETLCERNEQVILSCSIANSSRVLSICSSKVLTATEGYLQYRFGRIGAIEMTYPATKVETQEKFRWTTNYHADVIDSWLTFKSGAYVYSVFGIEERRANDKNGGRRYGVITTNNNDQEHSLRCKRPIIDFFSTLDNVVPEGDMAN